MAPDELLSVGVLYDLQEVISVVGETPRVPADQLAATGSTHFRVAAVAALQELLIEVGWGEVRGTGEVVFHPKIGQLRALQGSESRLRWQIFEILRARPPAWAGLIPYGRSEVLPYLRPNVVQCFDEAGLLDKDDETAVAWWLRAAALFRDFKEQENLKTGHLGEALSREYERLRTGFVPSWQSVDSARSGYDLLSRVAQNDAGRLLIEVKASMSQTGAVIHVTRNEWNVARRSEHYLFHLWLVNSLELSVVPAHFMRPHMPGDRGRGKWESTAITFDAFDGHRSEIPTAWRGALRQVVAESSFATTQPSSAL